LDDDRPRDSTETRDWLTTTGDRRRPI